jgi:hypothetical protein
MATTEEVQRALTKIKQLQAEVEETEEAIKNLKGFVAVNTGEGEHEVGHFKVTVYKYKKFDEAYGKRNAPELWEQFAVERRVLDSKTAKAKLDEDQYALFQKASNDLSVKVELLPDED